MLRNACLAVALIGLAACGGGGGGGGGDNAAPTVVICFPSPVALTDAATIVVRGTATDTSGVATLLVNGVAATTSDNFATWQATVPLAAGANAIAVDATDGAGNNNPAAATSNVTRDANATTSGAIGAGTALSSPADVVIDQARNRLLIADAGNAALTAVDLATGNRTFVSQGAIGGGQPAALSDARGMAANFIGSVVYLADLDLDLVVAVNIISGIRAIVSDSSVGGAPTFPESRGIAFESNRFYLVDRTNDYLISALVTSGNARAVNSDNADTGPNYELPQNVKIDISNNRAYVTEVGTTDALLSVDLATGNKTTVSSAAVGTGGPPGFNSPVALALDLTNNRAVMQLAGSNATIFANLTNGNRTTISDAGTGNGPGFAIEAGLAYDAVKLLVYVTDVSYNAVLLVDVVSGDRVFLTK